MNVMYVEKRGLKITSVKNEKMLVHENELCKKIFIPKKFCTIILQNVKQDDIEISQLGDDVCIENIGKDMPCQKNKRKIK